MQIQLSVCTCRLQSFYIGKIMCATYVTRLSLALHACFICMCIQRYRRDGFFITVIYALATHINVYMQVLKCPLSSRLYYILFYIARLVYNTLQLHYIYIFIPVASWQEGQSAPGPISVGVYLYTYLCKIHGGCGSVALLIYAPTY